MLKLIIERLTELKQRGERSKKKAEPKPIKVKGQMVRHPPQETRIKDERASRVIISSKYPGVIKSETYIINTKGTSNKFHFFAIVDHKLSGGSYTYIIINAYGRIGYLPRLGKAVQVTDWGDAERHMAAKVREKMNKGYRMP